MRFYNPKESNFDDDVVADYLVSVGESPLAYRSYQVTSKREGQADRALLRYNRSSSVLSKEIEELYRIAGSWLDLEFGPYLSGSQILTYDQAREWLKDDTSAGMPWTQRYPLKLDYHLSDDGNFFAKYWDVLATPQYVRSLCSVAEKVELRPKEKVDNGEVRTIISMDVNHVTAHHMMCHDQDARLIASHKYHVIKLGMDMFNGGFHQLNEFMTKFGNGANVIELDGRQFDSRFLPIHFDEIHRFRYRMLAIEHRTEENYRRLAHLYTELVSAPFVNVNGFVFGREVGNPSGQKCTTSDNSFKNFMDLCVLFMRLTGMREYSQFKAFINACIVGDDKNIEVHPVIQHLFNPHAIKSVMGELNMEYHFASMVFRENVECTFLGHSYKYCVIPHHGFGMYFPCIDGHKMRCSLLHYNEQQTVEQTIVRACSLRSETFPDEVERAWFGRFIVHLQKKFPPSNATYASAWKNYKTDKQLWNLFSGLE